MRTSQSVEQLMHNITHWQFVYEENKRLREELAKTTAIQQLNIKLATENASLRQQVSMVPDDFPIIASARVIRMPYGNFSHTLLLNVGIDQGVEKGAVVIASGKVVGRIIESSNRTSQVLMLTDMHSRIPATLASNRIQAILSGNSKGALRLTHMDKEHEIIAGDHLFTSGTGGIFPPGLYIGQIKDADKKTVRPAADLRRLDIVTIVGQPLKP
ncbi:MAG: rod shape-determining protein MreC [Alphaproteobacteria bacterium]